MMEGAPLCGTPTNVAADNEDRPAIHVSLATGLDENYFNWVAIGAEEEGVPCRQVSAQSSDPVAIAYDAAMSSRFGVGVGVTGNAVVIHELHMPQEQPVITFENSAADRETWTDNFLNYCRLAGGNAARLIIRLPFRFDLESTPSPVEQKTRRTPQPVVRQEAQDNTSGETSPSLPADVDPAMIKAIAKVVARIVKERGML